MRLHHVSCTVLGTEQDTSQSNDEDIQRKPSLRGQCGQCYRGVYRGRLTDRRVTFLGLWPGHLYRASHSEGFHSWLNSLLVAMLKFLIMSPLNLCFVHGDWWDNGACAWAKELCTVHMSLRGSSVRLIASMWEVCYTYSWVSRGCRQLWEAVLSVWTRTHCECRKKARVF